MGFRRRMLDASGDVALPPWACAVSRSWSWNPPSATRTAPSPRWSPTVKNVQVAVRAAPIDVVPMSAQHRLCRLRGYAAVGLLGGCCCFWSGRCLWWTVRGRDGSGFREVGINRADWPILRVPTTEGVVMGSPKSKVEEVGSAVGFARGSFSCDVDRTWVYAVVRSDSDEIDGELESLA